MAKRLRKRFPCPTEFTLAVLEGKWKSALLCCLTKRPCRYAELRRLMPGVSDKMLSSRLRTLVELGLVVRLHSNDRPSIQTYILSPLGYTLSEVLKDLSSWASEHAAAFGVRLVPALDSRQPRSTAARGWFLKRGVLPHALQSRTPTTHLPIGALMDNSGDRHTCTEQ